ncbi:MAG: hypothetical protein H7318_03115 [Oligoflexus sp.]|nr:hypothetical protein [Oligoflexus sp.]
MVQLGFGYYLGWLSQSQDWTLGEGLFIHAWWDVIAVTSSYRSERNVNKAAVLWMPAFHMAL